MKSENNPARYSKLLAPITREEANANLDAFFTEIGKLREKYHFPECLTVVKVNVEYADGECGEAISHCHYGSQLEAECLAAYALGQTQAQGREMVNKLLNRKGTRSAD